MVFDIQSFVAFGMLALVVVYLLNKFVVKPIRSKNQEKEGCGPGCSCDH